MFNEAKGYSGKIRYEIYPTKTNVVVTANVHKVKDNPTWTLSSVRIPNSIDNFRTLIPTLSLRQLNLLSASSINLHGLANTSIFHNNLRVMLSPLKSPVLRKYSNPFKRPRMYPSISKCNAKRCNCCMHLCTNSTVTSSVNGRKFSVVNNSDLD